MLVKIYAQPKVARPLKTRLSCAIAAVGSEDGEVEQRYSHTQAPCSPAEGIQISPLQTQPGPIIPCSPNEERAVDEDRVAQTDSEDDGN
ncbi:hypothetical protein FOTG_19150 [Fusarium oxysporum f. sp. vasinfectum 25433]|uniref:Uncharacterized protein n=1 Tax=Fusarium oxysporum f. sp. vasinfectum 25433 TaxID=1089449 RepID=X0LV20_FUSOX|nr:hypothetical protein FOTG_19150 [Fusarium oxysporum f. sp. vasinfectum 25433]